MHIYYVKLWVHPGHSQIFDYLFIRFFVVSVPDIWLGKVTGLSQWWYMDQHCAEPRKGLFWAIPIGPLRPGIRLKVKKKKKKQEYCSPLSNFQYFIQHTLT